MRARIEERNELNRIMRARIDKENELNGMKWIRARIDKRKGKGWIMKMENNSFWPFNMAYYIPVYFIDQRQLADNVYLYSIDTEKCKH